MSLAEPCRALVVRHHPNDHAGNFRAPLAKCGFDVSYWHPATSPVPDPESVDLLVIMGGVMGAHDEHLHPWLLDEIGLIERCLSRWIPTIGLCLGGQLLSRVYGAWVGRAERAEIGVLPIDLTPAGAESPVSEVRLADGHVLQWHVDRFDLPAGTDALATSTECPCQAWRDGAQVLALQFHPEAEAMQASGWIAGHPDMLIAEGVDPAAFERDVQDRGAALERMGSALMHRWLAQAALADEARPDRGGVAVL